MTTGLQRAPRRVQTGTGGPWVDFAVEILRATASLPDALCMGRGPDFDVENGAHDAIRAAVAVCQRCPALEPCGEWANSRKRHLVGVVAGKYRGGTTSSEYDESPRSATHDNE